MKVCKFCGSETDVSNSFCPKCGGGEFRFKCGNCQTVFENAAFCPNCGVKATAQARICPRCGAEFYKNVCPDCGYRVGDKAADRTAAEQPVLRQPAVSYTPAPKATKNKWVAFVLCIFLGFFGAHKFYEEKIGMGVLYLFTGGLFMIGWFIDIFVLLTKPEQYIP